MTSLAEQVVAIHGSLEAAGIPHAFGGALALAWCTEQARGTIDIDVNLFVGVEEADAALAALPAEVTVSDANRAAIADGGQARLWWDATPIDVFFNTSGFHAEAAGRADHRWFEGTRVPFLSCRDLAVFKTFFNRTRDWADLEEMAAAGNLDTAAVVGEVARHLGEDDERVERLRSL
ncbi:MAG: hypothetical protein H8E59_02325 [Actinobacteria bacterium]|nr:hypothetical protein [Actinomycetota bacterium]